MSSERDTTDSSVSRPSVLRYDVSGAGGALTATQQWDLTADLPSVGENAGAESVEWVPDTYLVAAGFVDQTTGAPYNPATYANHGTGLFFVGLEANGLVYAYALDQTSAGFTRVATFASGFPTFGALHWEPETNQLWVVCDNNCAARSRVFQVETRDGATRGNFVPVADYQRPTGMANLNNEGFTITPASECVGGSKPVLWADDGNNGGHVLRAGTIPCAPPAAAGWSAPASVKGDFNGDGFADLAVAAPGENAGAGAVHVLPGSASGLSATGSQYFTQNTAGIADSEEPGDLFGASLAVGDLTGDGFADLAVGVPGENGEAGAVHVLKGSASGLTATGSQFLSQNTSAIADTQEPGDHFGASLAIGDFGGTTQGDLAIGAPDEDTGPRTDAGVAHILPGSVTGVTGDWLPVLEPEHSGDLRQLRGGRSLRRDAGGREPGQRCAGRSRDRRDGREFRCRGSCTRSMARRPGCRPPVSSTGRRTRRRSPMPRSRGITSGRRWRSPTSAVARRAISRSALRMRTWAQRSMRVWPMWSRARHPG